MTNKKIKLQDNIMSKDKLSVNVKIIENYPLLIFIFFSFLVAFFVFKNFFFGDFLYFFKDIGNDSINVALPNYIQGKNLTETDGFFKFWSFYIGMGQPCGNSITLNPFIYLNKLLIVVFGVKVWFYRIYIIYFLYMLPAGIVAFYYFRLINVSKYVSIIGGLLFQFSGYMIIGSQWGHAYKIFYFIFLVFSFEQILLKNRWWYFVIAIYLLSDNFFMLAVDGLFLFTYSLVRYFDVRDGKIKGYFLMLLKMVGLGILAIFLNAPRALPNFLKMYFSPRIAGDSSLAHQLIANPEQIDGHLRFVTTILRFFANDLLGTGSDFSGWSNYLEAPIFYIGLISLSFFTVIFAFLKRKKRYIYLAFVVFWLLVAFVPILRHSVNFFVGDYFKNSIDIFVPFVILFLAMLGLDKVLSKEKINPLFLIVPSGILLLLLNYPYFEFNAAVVSFKMRMVISLLIIFYNVLLYLLNQGKQENILKIVLLLLIIVELSYISYPASNNRDVLNKYDIVNNGGYNDKTVDAVNFIKSVDTTNFYRIEKDYVSKGLNDAQAQNYFGTSSYNSFNQLNYIYFLQAIDAIKKGRESQSRWAPGVRGIPLMMTFASVKYYLTTDINNPLKFNGYDSIATFDSVVVLKNNYFLPLGFTYDKYLPLNDFMKLSVFKRQQALLSAVILDDKTDAENLLKLDTNLLVAINQFNLDIYVALIDSLRQNTFNITKFKNKKIEGNISLNTDKILFFSIPYDKGWTIYANGEKITPEMSNVGFTSIYLKKGNYNIELKYLPLYFYQTIVLAVISLIILSLIFYKITKNKRTHEKLL